MSSRSKRRNLDGAAYGLLTLCSCVCLAVPAFLLEGAAAYYALQSTDSMIVLSLVARSGALYYLSNEFSFRVLGMLDPVSQAVANAKRVFVLAAAAVFWAGALGPEDRRVLRRVAGVPARRLEAGRGEEER